MPEELLGVLTRFHREVVIPDIERIFDAKLNARISGFRDDMLANFDAVFKWLDQLSSQYRALSPSVQRLEHRMAAVEQKIDRVAFRPELIEL